MSGTALSTLLAAVMMLRVATPVTAPPVTLPRTEVVHLKSHHGLEYQLSVSLPRSYTVNDKGLYPVIYLLDSDYSFGVVRNLVEHLADRGGLPEAVIVGIGYPGGIEGADWQRRYRLQRTRDYTPTRSLKGYPEGVQEVSGGGAAFLAFLETELVPLVEHRYRTRPGDRTLVGHSYGGLFALYAALTRPALFAKIVSISPSLWYDNRWLPRYEESERSKRGAITARLFIAAGTLETGTEQDIAGEATRFGAVLAKLGLDTTLRLFDQENHDSVFPVAVTRGLRTLFDR